MKKSYNNLCDVLFDLLQQTQGSYASRSMTTNLDKTRNVVYTLSISDTHQQYEGITVEIINKQTGKIASQYFPFKQFLQPNMKTVTNPDLKDKIYVWKCMGKGYEWYGAVPTADSVMQMYDAMDMYISKWK